MQVELAAVGQYLHPERGAHGAGLCHGVFGLSQNVCFHHAGPHAVNSGLHTGGQGFSGGPHALNFFGSLDAADFIAGNGNIADLQVRRGRKKALVVFQADKVPGKSQFRRLPILAFQPGAHHRALTVGRKRIGGYLLNAAGIPDVIGLHPETEQFRFTFGGHGQSAAL